MRINYVVTWVYEGNHSSFLTLGRPALTGVDLGMWEGGGHIVYIYIYMERSDRMRTDANSYQTKQCENETTRMV